MRIAITNDMALAVEALRRVVIASGEHQVAWVARDGQEAVEKCREDRPDLILMDLMMPVLDGVEATRAIMAESPCAVLIVTSSVSRMAPKVFEALGAGALDAIKTPTLGPDLEGSRLLAKIRQLRPLIERREPASSPFEAVDFSDTAPRHTLIVLGASSGGPAALCRVLRGLPPLGQASVLLAQHIDFEFMPGLMAWLSAQSGKSVTGTEAGRAPRPGEVLMACSVDHVCLTRRSTMTHCKEPEDCPYRPSIDVLMHSVAAHWPGPAVGVILTGMGADGAEGLLAMRSAGHHTIAQDRASSAIYGMPRAAFERGAATEVLPLEAIASALGGWMAAQSRTTTRRSEDVLI